MRRGRTPGRMAEVDVRRRVSASIAAERRSADRRGCRGRATPRLRLHDRSRVRQRDDGLHVLGRIRPDSRRGAGARWRRRSCRRRVAGAAAGRGRPAGLVDYPRGRTAAAVDWFEWQAILEADDDATTSACRVRFVALGTHSPVQACRPSRPACRRWRVVDDRRRCRRSAVDRCPLTCAFRTRPGTARRGSGRWHANRLEMLVDNAIHRYAIGDRSNLRFNDDGSLEIYIACVAWTGRDSTGAGPGRSSRADDPRTDVPRARRIVESAGRPLPRRLKSRSAARAGEGPDARDSAATRRGQASATRRLARSERREWPAAGRWRFDA